MYCEENSFWSDYIAVDIRLHFYDLLIANRSGGAIS